VAESLFSLRAVHASRGGRPVLRDLDLDVPAGMTAVRGPSGSGKTTLLRLLNRLSDPEHGTVAYEGHDVRGLDPLELRRRVCLVPQLPALIEGDVAHNVRLGPSLCGRDADVARCLELAGLGTEYAARESGRLSVGEQQRVMLARALALDPEVLLLDEPTSALDEESRAGVEHTLVELVTELDTSAVVVTHDRAQAERLAGHSVLDLEGGRAG
jgi:putative ABC transport system ATP-binding protein